MAFVRKLPCVSCTRWTGPVDASHMTLGPNEKGIGMKVSDYQVVPHCRTCHGEWEERRGRFLWMSKEERWLQAAAWVTETRIKAILAGLPPAWQTNNEPR